MIAVLATDRPRKQTGATQAGAALVGVIDSTVTDEERIAVMPAAGGALRFVSPADTFVYEYDWTPDGSGFAATAAKGDGDNNWWIATLVAVGLDQIRVLCHTMPYELTQSVAFDVPDVPGMTEVLHLCV